jgi:phage tail-like protein
LRPVAGGGALSLAANFTVHINDTLVSCARISGLELASAPDALERKEDPDSLAGVLWSAPAQPGRVVLARALDGDRTLYQWRREALSGKPAVREVSIRHLDRSGGKALHIWRLTSAWPLRWSGPGYDALHGGIAFEELELVFHDLIWQGG